MLIKEKQIKLSMARDIGNWSDMQGSARWMLTMSFVGFWL